MDHNRRGPVIYRFIALILLILLAPSVARADCVSPAGTAGKVVFDDTTASMQYCNGAAWVKFPKFDPPSGWLQLAAGNSWNTPYACGITNDGDAWCWGDDTYGRLGNGAGTTGMQLTPTLVAGGYKWKQISVSDDYACGLRTDNVAMCWGGAGAGGLGNGTWNPDQPAPVLVSGGYTWSMISAGGSHACGIRPDGVAMCWGSDGNGKLGNGAGGSVNAPGVVSGGYTWSHIEAGDSVTCGVTTTGTGYCWGQAADGRLGNGTTTPDMQTPSAVSGGHTWQTISTGAYAHTCGLTTGGDAYCWGTAGDGRLGNGTWTPDVNTPSLVSGGHEFQFVDVGSEQTCALTTANVGYCWGNDGWGRTGTGGTFNIPTLLQGGHSWASLSSGGSNGCGVRTDGQGMCWGRADTGALGNGTTSPDQSAPVFVGVTDASCTLGTLSTTTAYDNLNISDITFGNGLFAVVEGTNDPSVSGVWTSPDGMTWTRRHAYTEPLARIAYGNGVFVGIQSWWNSNVVRSTDGITWTDHAGATPFAPWNDLTFGNGTFVAVTEDTANRAMTSPDGITWTARTIPGSEQWNAVAYGNGRFVAVAINWDCTTCAAVSTDNGATWTTNAGFGGNYADITFAKGLFVGIRAVGEIATSPDGVTWTARATGITDDLEAITYGNGRFLVASSGGNFLTSTDGITWTVIPGTPANAWGGMAYGNGKFVAASWGDWGNDDTQRVAAIPCLGECVNPTEPAGSILYNDTRRVMQWCDGTSWHAMGPDNPGGASGGCSNPSGGAGKMILNADYFTMQYCDGGTWRSVGKVCEPHECGLVHHWKLDETTVTAGSTIVDSIGGANGTVTGTLNSVPGKNGSAILLNADNEFIGNIGTLDALTNKTQFTLSAWVKRNSAGSRMAIGDYSTTTAASAYLGTFDDGMMYWGVGNSGTGIDDEASYANNDTNWHMMTLVYNGTLSGNSNRLRIYLDGVNIGSPTYGGTIPATSYASGLPFFIGTYGTPIYSRGTIDDVRIYNRPLSATDVAALYAATSDPCTASSPVIGSVCADGSVYAGLSPDGNVKMYTTTASSASDYSWNNTSGNTDTMADCTTVPPGAQSTCQTGEANTALLAALGDSGAPYAAATYCNDLVAHGQNDWYLPAADELKVLYDNRTAIGGYANAYHWSSSEHNSSNARILIHGGAGTHTFAAKFQLYRVRCVRK